MFPVNLIHGIVLKQEALDSSNPHTEQEKEKESKLQHSNCDVLEIYSLQSSLHFCLGLSIQITKKNCMLIIVQSE